MHPEQCHATPSTYLLNKSAVEVYVSTPDTLAVLMQLQGAQQSILDGLHGRLYAVRAHQAPDQITLGYGHYFGCSCMLIQTVHKIVLQIMLKPIPVKPDESGDAIEQLTRKDLDR